MSKEELNKALIEALDGFEHQSYQITANDAKSLELAKAIYKLMDRFRESIIDYLQ
ncbi:MAG: hypothetical protein ACI4FZ_07635 [Lachnospiraceae bacterium]